MRRLLKCLSAAGALLCALTLPGAHAQRDGRIGTPSDLRCPRDNTTAFTGRVLAYSRGRGRVFIKVRTDEQTTEQFTLHYGRGDFKTLFRLRGEPLGSGDLAKIEVRPGRLRRGMRATVWACYKGDDLGAERIDWRPPEE
ncbi:MAG TPA: hypothetical protein VGX48_07730 [Pyrinomonadaceae bacterium]|nr:hypothetical protein [Pyrinomonadaceae bacterium]